MSTIRKAVCSLKLTVDDVLAKVTLDGDNVVTHDGCNKEVTMTSATTVAATKVASGTWTLSTGTLTVDLTAVTDAEGATITTTGLKVKAILLTAPSTNTGVITIAKGASNGYEIIAATADPVLPVPIGGTIGLYCANQATAVASGAKTLDLVGTGSETVEFVIVFGA